MVHILYSIGRKLISISIVAVIIIMLCSQINVSAVTTTGYNGKYDLTAHHEVNHQYNWVTGEKDETKIYNNLKAVYQQCLAWGLTKEGAAAVCGNFMNEGGMGATDSVEDMKPWEDYVYGASNWGIGMMGFTEESLVRMLFDNAYEMGVQWMDLGAQLKTFHDYYFPLDTMFTTSNDIDALTDYFMEEYERPYEYNYSQRRASAREALERYKDLPAKEYDGIDSSYADPNDNVSIESDSIISEWELTGMPAKSNLSVDAALGDVKFVTVDNIEDVTQKYSVAVIKEDIESLRSFNAWTTARTVVVFIGLILLIYALLLTVALLFDRVNNILDMSLVSALTLGLLKFSDDKELESEGDTKDRYVNTKKMVIIIIIIALVGGLLVAGGVIPFVMKSIYNITNSFS